MAQIPFKYSTEAAPYIFNWSNVFASGGGAFAGDSISGILSTACQPSDLYVVSTSVVSGGLGAMLLLSSGGSMGLSSGRTSVYQVWHKVLTVRGNILEDQELLELIVGIGN